MVKDGFLTAKNRELAETAKRGIKIRESLKRNFRVSKISLCASHMVMLLAAYFTGDLMSVLL